VLRFFACALACALALVAISPAAPVPQHLMKQPVYYFPTKVGTKLVYEELDSDIVRPLVVMAVEDHDGVKVVSVGRVAQDQSVSPCMTMTVAGGGLYLIKRGEKKIDTPETWLKLPANRDLSWEYPIGDPDISPRPQMLNTISGEEDVTVPAGTFHCVRVRSRQGARATTCWFAPEVGLVKLEATTWTEVLKSYTPGKD
jgi:hypothetical protein